MFSKILIANRGEIACRVIKTAQRLGVKTVAVYLRGRRPCPPCGAGRRGRLHRPGAQPRLLSCRPTRSLPPPRQTGAQAIHPGYGFLSENEDFARRVEEEGLIFIGPKHGAIAAMGDKIASKRLAMQAGVSTIPGHNEPILTAEEAVAIAQRIGYPVMIKASAGGGGKGLRVALQRQGMRRRLCELPQ